MNQLEIGKTALITTDNWFISPDGTQKKAVFGTVHAIKTDEQALGVKTNARSTNWYVEIGNMTIAGCQIFYAIRTDLVFMNFDDVEEGFIHEGKEVKGPVKSRIYNADHYIRKLQATQESKP